MNYNYQRAPRARIAADARHTSYEDALQRIQTTFVGEVGESVYEYIGILHKRIRSREPWTNLPGFTSWDYGSVHSRAANLHQIRVYQKDPSLYPGDIDPVINITLEFLSSSIGVEALAGRARLFAKAIKLDTSPSYVALEIGASWEKLLTGSVDYGD
jgi:hypothetical protein